jgi:propanediol utilization protein
MGVPVEQLEITFGGPLRIVVEQPQPTDITARLTIIINGFKITGERLMYTLPVDHFAQMEVSYVDAKGNPAEIDGPVTWQSSDDTVVTLDVDQSDSSIVKVTPVGKIGQVQITATADADLGAGVKTLVTPCDIEVVAGEAVAGTIQPLGEPQPIG